MCHWKCHEHYVGYNDATIFILGFLVWKPQWNGPSRPKICLRVTQITKWQKFVSCVEKCSQFNKTKSFINKFCYWDLMKHRKFIFIDSNERCWPVDEVFLKSNFLCALTKTSESFRKKLTSSDLLQRIPYNNELLIIPTGCQKLFLK